MPFGFIDIWIFEIMSEIEIPSNDSIRFNLEHSRLQLRMKLSSEKQNDQQFFHSYLIKIFFASVKKRSASHPPSRPTPDAFTPPKGVLKSLTSQAFIHTIPDCN